jgi:hypothetical protein
MTPEEAASAATFNGFYQIVDNGEVIESGYQEQQILSDETYYAIALPKVLDFNTMVELRSWDSDEKAWVKTELVLTSDPDTVAACCEEAGIDISQVDTELYTIWVEEDLCTGKTLRYIIKEG